MLIGFQVENFRSFKERQTFSMVAGNYPEHLNQNTFDPKLRGFDRLLRTAVIYGPNAAGKTNLLKAIKFVKDFVVTSAASTASPYPYSPFKLSAACAKKASEFQISFVQDGARYEYGFSMGPKQIESEWLTEYRHLGLKSRPRDLFTRTWRPKGGYEWKFSPSLKGERSTWSKSTRPDALFLSTAIQLNSAQLRPIYEWFQTRLVVIAGNVKLNQTLTLNVLEEPNGKERLLPFLREADLGIADFDIKREPVPQGGGVVLGARPILHASKINGAQFITVTLTHPSDKPGVMVGLPLDEESSGTQILFNTAGAWLNVIANGEVLLFDEIDTNLHPRMLRFLIERFQSKKNSKNAQLICSTHNTTLLDRQMFRRDQFWFVEKQKNGASKLYPLTDFSPRNDEVLESWYLRGRYGAQPLLPYSEG